MARGRRSSATGGGVKRPGSTLATTPRGSGRGVKAPLARSGGRGKAIAAVSKDVAPLEGATGSKPTSGRKIKY